MRVTCHRCGKEFSKKPSQVARDKRHFCSKYCYDTIQREEAKDKQLRMTGKCEWCGKEYSFKASSKSSFCSAACWYEYNKNQTERVVNVCPICGERKTITKAEFDFNGGQVCCSRKCGWIRERRRVSLVCQWCGGEFAVPQSRSGDKYCSKECDNEARRVGQIEIECPACHKKLKRTPALVRRVGLSFCSRECMTAYFRGERSRLWKGGISSELRRLRGSREYKKWRTAVFERDNYICQSCGQMGAYLHPHHIKSFAEHGGLRFDVDNGVTLCEKCHGEVHGINYAPCSRVRTTER